MLSRDSKVINVGIAEIMTAKSPNILRTTLGSCIGVVLYQPDLKIGAISHIMLAKDPIGRDTYFARIFGAASMFKNITSNFLNNIGENNITIVREFFAEKKIPIIAEDIGGHEGRTISLYLDDGRILLKKSGIEKYLYKVR